MQPFEAIDDRPYEVVVIGTGFYDREPVAAVIDRHIFPPGCDILLPAENVAF